MYLTVLILQGWAESLGGFQNKLKKKKKKQAPLGINQHLMLY